VEQVLAPVRVGVALFCVIAFNVNATRYAAPAQALVAAYLGLFGQVLLVTLGGPAGGRFLGRPVEFDLVITRCSYVLIGALLLGYMAETEKELRAEGTPLCPALNWRRCPA
jgi:hypothetical protein